MASNENEKMAPDSAPQMSEQPPTSPDGTRRSTPAVLTPPTAPQPGSLAARHRRPSMGMQVAHGIPIPPGMAEPLAEGYRTPTYEDYEMHFQNPPAPAPMSPASPAPSAAPSTAPSRAGSVTSGTANGPNEGTHQRARIRHTHLPRAAHKHHHHIHLPKVRPLSAVKSPLSFANMSDMLDEKLQWRERIRHFTWNFFSMTMATGGIANVLYHVPYRFNGLDGIGVFFFLSNLVLYVLCIILISCRFILYPETFKASFMHPTESLFMPSAVVSFATVLLNICQYGLFHIGEWLNEAVIVLYWIFVVMAIAASSGIYLLIWSTQSFTVAAMTPVWIFPAYPLLVVGPLAAHLGGEGYIDQPRSLLILVAGFACQGVGFLVSVTIYSAFIYRLMTQKLPQENVRPGMFVSVGPSGFTCAAIAGMAANAPRALPADFMGDGRLAGMVMLVVGNFASLWFWGLAVWFFIVSVGAHWTCLRKRGKLQFGMTWFSFVFPNTALITATFAVGKAFGAPAIEIIGCVMTCGLIIVWILVVAAMAHAIATRRILWPQKGEDRDEGGFKGPEKRRPSRLSVALNVERV